MEYANEGRLGGLISLNDIGNNNFSRTSVRIANLSIIRIKPVKIDCNRPIWLSDATIVRLSSHIAFITGC